MKNSILFLLILLVAIAGGVGLFYLESRLPDNELVNLNVNGQLLRVDTLDANINELALRSRANLDTNYDMLVRSTTALERAISDLSSGYFFKSEISGSMLDSRFDKLKESMEIKVDHVENFKSSNSVLRNSERYIPLVGRQLTSTAQKNELPEIADLYRQIVIDMLEYTRQGSNTPRAAVADFKTQILETETTMPTQSSIKILEFSNHVVTATEAKEKTDQYLRKVLNSSADDQIEGISTAWSIWKSEQDSSQEVLRNYIIAYVLTMLGLIGILVYRLRNVYTSLDREVEAKTNEIKAAYEDLKESEQQIVQSEKMASLGQLVAGVAHEINTPLGYITANMETVKSKLNRLAPVLENVESISTHVADPNRDKSQLMVLLKAQIVAHRSVGKNNKIENVNTLVDDASQGLHEIKDIVDALTNFSHVQDAPKQAVDINERIENTIKVVTKSTGERKLHLDLADETPAVEGVPNQLTQVFTNVINNAVHATDAINGEIWVSTKAAGDSVEISIKDNGGGIDEAALKRVFEPFFTTKKVGEGTGLGLSIAHQIVSAHGGELGIDSKVGFGTVVVVKLPSMKTES